MRINYIFAIGGECLANSDRQIYNLTKICVLGGKSFHGTLN